MPKKNGAQAAPENTPNSVSSEPVPDTSPHSQGRLTAAHALTVIAFPVLGCVLYIVGGMPVKEIFIFLSGCGAIGAAVTLLGTSSGRHTLGIVGRALIAASSGK